MKITIVMYHYVRDLKSTPFPELKGLSVEQFNDQIDYIKKHYNVISGDALLDAADSGSLDELPPRALLLTFDDGYMDHFTEVFPVLQREGLPGCFFPPAKCILENHVLDVNKIHFVLACEPVKQVIVDYIFQMLAEHGQQYQAQSKDYYWAKLAVANRFDPKEVVFIKRILQRELPERLRQIIINGLFKEYVTSDEASFARELYMDIDHLAGMRASGMYVGSHGYGHYWLNSIEPGAQSLEIERALEFLNRIGARADSWIMCYPYGAYDDSLLSLLRKANCKIGLTTRVGIVDTRRDHLLTLPRLDTNDLPRHSSAKPNEWALQAEERRQG